MKKGIYSTIALVVVMVCAVMTAQGETVTTRWGGDAEMMYDAGFMNMLMKHPAPPGLTGGVCLFNMELIGNDAPGSGYSEKGVSSDMIWGSVRARKLLFLDDPRAESAWLVIYPTDHTGSHPLKFTVNGHESRIDSSKSKEDTEWYLQGQFQPDWLKKGRNVIELYCPEAQTEQEGWDIYIARADEFTEGGGDPTDVGKTSFKSVNGGETWKESPFGPLGQTRAEYSVRLSLDRYIKNGWLSSPIIDLWKGDSQDVIVPQREIRKMTLAIRAEAPGGTRIEYFLRKGTSPDPFAQDWGPYEFVGEGPNLNFETGGADLNRRYVQFKAVLSTDNPLVSPVIKSAQVTAELFQRVPRYRNIFVVESDNPPIKYSSINWEWEPWDRPEFQELRERENLDEVIAGSRTEFDAQVKLLDYVTRRWRHDSPFPEFPGWDALSILNRIDSAGGGGYCLTFNNALGGLCTAYGWQARFVNVIGHEVVEVWNDEFGKWIFLDADYENNYNFDPESAEPLSMLELHNLFLDYYFPDRPIRWLQDEIIWMKAIEGKPVPVRRGSLTWQKKTTFERIGTPTGFCNAGFLRMIPRNNWFEKPFPRPLTHGNGNYCPYPWGGYINWYDSRTPPKRNHSWYTDRPRDMWPDLNTVHVDMTQGFGNDRLFLRFETYTPNFSYFEVNVDDTGWKKTGERWTWLLQSGRNNLRVRAVSKLGVKGKPSVFVLNHGDAPFGE